MSSRVIACAVVALAATAFAAGTTTARAAQPQLFAWSMDAQFVPDAHGRFRDTPPAEVRSGPWHVTLQLTGAPCVDADVYHWSVKSEVRGTEPIVPRRTVACAFSMEVPRLGSYNVALTANVQGQRFH